MDYKFLYLHDDSLLDGELILVGEDGTDGWWDTALLSKPTLLHGGAEGLCSVTSTAVCVLSSSRRAGET